MDIMVEKTLFLFVCFILSCFFIISTPRSRRKPLPAAATPPGPPRLPIIGNINLVGKDPHCSFASLSKIYGPVMSLKLGFLNTVVVTSPEAAREVLRTHDQVLSNRGSNNSIDFINHQELSLVWLPSSTARWRALMANPWFPGNSNSVLSPLLRSADDNPPDPFPPDPPDPDPDNPLSLSRFPPLNSPASRSPKTSRSLLQTPPRSSVSKASSSTLTAAASAKANPNSSAVPFFSRSSGTVQFDSQNFKILPPKSPIQTNQASNLSPFPPPLNPLPKSPIPPSNQNPNCSSSTAKTPILNPDPNLCSSSATHRPPPPLNVQPPPPYPKTHNSTSTPPVDPPLVERIRKSQDKSLSRQAPPSFSDSGRPRVLIPDSVFQKGAELHRDFIICYFNGRPPPFNHIQSVLNHLWGKGRRVEIHTNPLSRSMLVRIPSDYLRQKILEKRVWYVGDSMFQAVQWTSSASPSSPPLDSIQIWAHLTGIPLDLRHQQGLSLVAGLVGEPKETDDFTLNLVSLTLSHVKVEVDLTIPLPCVVEFTRESGEVVEVSVAYPWVPPTGLLCWQGCLYWTWTERNARLHRNTSRPFDVITRLLDRQIKDRILSFRTFNPSVSSIMMQQWLS